MPVVARLPLTLSCDCHHGITVRTIRELELIDVVSLQSYTPPFDREFECACLASLKGELTISKYVV